ncbi:MAG: hypothetical protein ACTHJ9_08425 [Rhodanobacter sp.]
MAKQGTKTSMPRLRFPEFHQTGDWTTASLGTLTQFVTERVGSSDCVPYTVTSGVGLVSQQEKLGRTIAGQSLKNYIILQRDDFAYNKSATKAFPQGFIARYDGRERAAVPNSIFTCFRLDDEDVHPVFLENLFISNLHGNWLRGRIAIGARAHGSLNVSDDDLMALPVPLPPFARRREEQQKIADCLTSLDEVIAAQGRKVEALKAHKRGLMQQLFPRQGETRPRLRFPEFSKASEWRDEPVSALIRTVAPPQKIATSGYQQNGCLAIVDQSPDPVCGWTDDLSAKVTASLPLIVFGDHTCVLKLIEHDFAQGADGIKIISAKSCVDVRFLFYALQADPIVSTSYRRHFALLQEKLVRFPEDANEQQRIADCLASLDTRITAETSRLAALKSHKQGLMQQLFPTPEARGA